MTMQTDPPVRERSEIIERALLTGLASGGTIEQIAVIVSEPLPALVRVRRALRERFGAKTDAHLVARVLGQVPCARCGEVLAARYAPSPPAPAEPTPTGALCPDCGGLLHHTEGCERCPTCGFSRC